MVCTWRHALSGVAISPSRNRRYISTYASSGFFAWSCARVAEVASYAANELFPEGASAVFPLERAFPLEDAENRLSISLSVARPKTRKSDVTGKRRLRSIFTYRQPSGSDSTSIHTPRAGIIFAAK